jgi:hypothetical protein
LSRLCHDPTELHEACQVKAQPSLSFGLTELAHLSLLFMNNIIFHQHFSKYFFIYFIDIFQDYIFSGFEKEKGD